jgi:hypothetical protein
MRFLAPVLVALCLFVVSCATAPIAYHDGLPASVPPPGYAAARLGYNRMYWWHGYSEPDEGEYIFGGFRLGQDWRRMCFEEGMTLLFPNGVLPCLQVGVGLRNPAVMVRGMWTPVAVTGGGVTVDPLAWWQISGLVGTPWKERGLGASVGARTSRLGIGPVAVLEYSTNGGAFRLESSMTFRAPWADENVSGRVLTVGLSLEPSRDILHK